MITRSSLSILVSGVFLAKLDDWREAFYDI